MTNTANIFETALERYQAGESPESLIPVFQEICANMPKNGAAWSCLAWLYLLTDEPQEALKAAKKSIKLDKQAPQARINMALAMLDSQQAGVRQHIQVAQQLMAIDKEVREMIAENIQDGLTRKPDWQSLLKIQKWLFNK